MTALRSSAGEGRWRWPRLLAIAAAAVVLASCRAVTQPLVVPLATGVVAARGAPGCRDCESSAPAHPRLPCRGGPCADGRCAAGPCSDTPCPAPAEFCAAVVPPVPLAAPCLVCDGGDAGKPAVPVARLGLKNLTAGDTVARYRAADDGPDGCDVHVTASNCACVYAPRFGSVREVTRPHEDARPIGPRGLALDTSTASQVDLAPVCGKTQTLAVVAARKALPGVAVEERLAPLAVDNDVMPHGSEGRVWPAEDIRDEHAARTELVQTPRIAVGFVVPLAWTCARAAMVVADGRRAEVVAADRGTATLRIESPGRAELTLCKRAGSDTARVGEELDFTIYLHNSGDRPLTDVVLVDALPGRLDLVPDSAAASQPADFSTVSGDDGSVVLRWQFRHTFRPGEGGFVRFRTIVR